MSKKLKSIIIGGVVLLVLFGMLILLLNLPEQSGENSSDGDEIHVLIKEEKDPKSIKISNQYGDYTVNSLGETNGLTQYSIEELEGLPLISQDLYILASDRRSLATYFVVEDTSKGLAAFGLDTPKAVVEVDFGETKYKIKLGDYGSDKSYIYAMVNEDEKIYAIPNTSGEFAFKAKEEYVVKNIIEGFTFESAETTPIVNEVIITRDNLPYDIKLRKLQKEEEISGNVMQTPIKVVSPIDALAGTDAIEKHVIALFGLTANSVVKGLPTESDLKKYGINDKSDKLYFNYNTSEYTLIVGDGFDASGDKDSNKINSYYVYVPENKIIYGIDSSKITFKEVVAKDLISSIALLVYIGDLDSVDVKVNDKSHTFDVTNTFKEDGSINETFAKADGKDVDVTNFKYLLQLMLDTPIEDVYLDKKLDKEPTILITYNYTNGKSETVSLTEKSVRTAVIAVNGDQKYTARTAYVEKLVKEINNLIEGKDVSNEW